MRIKKRPKSKKIKKTTSQRQKVLSKRKKLMVSRRILQHSCLPSFREAVNHLLRRAKKHHQMMLMKKWNLMRIKIKPNLNMKIKKINNISPIKT